MAPARYLWYNKITYIPEMAGNDMEKQIKSKKRVADHGEVFTAEREVNAMLDLVKFETERVDSRFLEIIIPSLIQNRGIIKKYPVAV